MSQIKAYGIHSTDATGKNFLKFNRQSGCLKCHHSNRCGSRVLESYKQPLTFAYSGNFSPDDSGRVEVQISGSSLIALAAFCHLLPAVLVVFGGWLGSVLVPAAGDKIILLGSLVGLGVASLVLGFVRAESPKLFRLSS